MGLVLCAMTLDDAQAPAFIAAVRKQKDYGRVPIIVTYEPNEAQLVPAALKLMLTGIYCKPFHVIFSVASLSPAS